MGEKSRAHINAQMGVARAIRDLKHLPILFRLAADSANGDGEELRTTSLENVKEIREAANTAINSIMTHVATLRQVPEERYEPDTLLSLLAKPQVYPGQTEAEAV